MIFETNNQMNRISAPSAPGYWYAVQLFMFMQSGIPQLFRITTPPQQQSLLAHPWTRVMMDLFSLGSKFFV
jgi:hypothetical protein